MRIPTGLTIFVATAAVGAAIVAGPHAFARDAQATSDADRLIGLAPATPTASPRAATPSGKPRDPLPPGASRVLHNKATGECLDSDDKGDVYLHECNGGPFQHWTVKDNDDDTRTLVNDATKRCLDNDRDSEDGGRIYTLSCNGGAFQKWFVITDDQNRVSFQNDETRLCLWNSPFPTRSITCDKSIDGAWWTSDTR